MKKKDLLNYDYYIVAFSGGKDSLACLLHLIDSGVPKEKIELWHHCIDGREGSTLMDWPVTTDYCSKIANYFKIPIYFSWKEGGFEREMNRKDALTAPCYFEYPKGEDNVVTKSSKWASYNAAIGIGASGGINGKKNTRRKFPQVSADLRVRWCSAYLKIDVCKKALANQPRFNNKRTLLITGERAEESTSRAKYKTLEPHSTDTSRRPNNRNDRFVDQWRPIHKWDETKVWAIIEKHKIEPHVAYQLGWGRLSCQTCIFGSANQWASADAIDSKKVDVIRDYENQFQTTIHRKLSVGQQMHKGKAYASITPDLKAKALLRRYNGKIFNKDWKLPAGAFGESTGPT